MKDKFDELLEELNLDDFDAKDATYQVWVLGYDENENITDFEVMVDESKDAESMVEYATNYVEEERYGTMEFPDEVSQDELKYMEAFYMGMISEFHDEDMCSYYVPDDVVWKGKKAICDYLGFKVDETEIYDDQDKLIE